MSPVDDETEELLLQQLNAMAAVHFLTRTVLLAVSQIDVKSSLVNKLCTTQLLCCVRGGDSG